MSKDYAAIQGESSGDPTLVLLSDSDVFLEGNAKVCAVTYTVTNLVVQTRNPVNITSLQVGSNTITFDPKIAPGAAPGVRTIYTSNGECETQRVGRIIGEVVGGGGVAVTVSPLEVCVIVELTPSGAVMGLRRKAGGALARWRLPRRRNTQL